MFNQTRNRLYTRKASVIVGLVLAAQLLQAGGPRIGSPEPDHDFGRRSAAEPVTHAFVIENRGDADLVLGRIHACCGATASLATNRIGAGQQTLLNVTLSLAGREGGQVKNLYLASNDASAPLYRLTLRGSASREATEPEDDMAEVPDRPAMEPADAGAAGRVVVEYFHEPGCPACRRIEARIMPQLVERYGERIDLRKWDVSEMGNVLRLMAYQDALALSGDHPVLIVVDYATDLNGVEAIENRLFDTVEAALARRQAPGFREPEPIHVPDFDDGVARGDARMQTFSLPAILVAGFIDGLNPCAMTALTFLMSLLAAAKVKGRRLLLLGLPYCLAAFLTYLMIGLGLLRAFHLFHAAPLIRLVVESVLIGGLLLVAALSFRDAWRFSRSGRADAVQVKLPRRFMQLSHAIMRRGVRGGHLVLGGFFAGAAVTAVDSVCTGQLYVPTLALMVRMADGAGSRQAWHYLLAYNAMFILPLVTVFLLVLTGLRNEALQRWSRRHVVPGKILMGLLMLALAVFLLVLRNAS